MISLFVRPTGPGGTEPDEETRRGHTILRWNEGDLAFELVSDLNREELRLLKDLVSHAATGGETRPG